MTGIILISTICELLLLVVGLYCLPYLNRTHKILILYAFITVVFVLSGRFIYYKQNNTHLFNIYAFLCTILFPAIAMQIAKTYENYKIFSGFALTGSFLSALIMAISLKNNGLYIFVNWGYTIGNVFITVEFLYILIQLFNNNNNSITKQPTFWVCLGVIIYTGGSIPIFGIINYMIKYHRSVASRIYDISEWLTIISDLMLSYAFLLQRKQNIKENTVRI